MAIGDVATGCTALVFVKHNCHFNFYNSSVSELVIELYLFSLIDYLTDVHIFSVDLVSLIDF